jgi:hypothetical protein
VLYNELEAVDGFSVKHYLHNPKPGLSRVHMSILTFKESVTTKVQYPIHYVQNMYISIHKVGVNGGGHGHLDIIDGPTLKKSLGLPF